MATRLQISNTTGRGVSNNKNNSSLNKVTFGAAPKNWKCQKSGLSGSQWRQQQKCSSRQKKMEEYAKGRKRQLIHAYDILRAGGNYATRVLRFAAQDPVFKKSVDQFLMAAGAEQALKMNQKLEWFHQKYCNREFDDKFLRKIFVEGMLVDVCNSAIYLAHFRKGGKVIAPLASSSEEESRPMVFARDQRRSLEDSAQSHPVAAVLAFQLQGNFAESSSGKPPCADPKTQQSEYPAAAASVVQLYAHEEISGSKGVIKAAAALADRQEDGSKISSSSTTKNADRNDMKKRVSKKKLDSQDIAKKSKTSEATEKRKT